MEGSGVTAQGGPEWVTDASECATGASECLYCAKTFKDRKNLYRHCRNVHKVEVNVGTFHCDVCPNVSYKTLQNLRQHHERLHGFKPLYETASFASTDGEFQSNFYRQERKLSSSEIPTYVWRSMTVCDAAWHVHAALRRICGCWLTCEKSNSKHETYPCMLWRVDNSRSIWSDQYRRWYHVSESN